MMTQTETPVLEAVRDLLDYESWPFEKDPQILISPDDVAKDPTVTPPFVIVATENDQVREKSGFRSLASTYNISIYFYLAGNDIVPSTPEFAQMELTARDIKQIIDKIVLENPDLNRTVRTVGTEQEFSRFRIDTLAYKTKAYSGCIYSFDVTQPI